jgi:hypothetical protein
MLYGQLTLRPRLYLSALSSFRMDSCPRFGWIHDSDLTRLLRQHRVWEAAVSLDRLWIPRSSGVGGVGRAQRRWSQYPRLDTCCGALLAGSPSKVFPGQAGSGWRCSHLHHPRPRRSLTLWNRHSANIFTLFAQGEVDGGDRRFPARLSAPSLSLLLRLASRATWLQARDELLAIVGSWVTPWMTRATLDLRAFNRGGTILRKVVCGTDWSRPQAARHTTVPLYGWPGKGRNGP